MTSDWGSRVSTWYSTLLLRCSVKHLHLTLTLVDLLWDICSSGDLLRNVPYNNRVVYHLILLICIVNLVDRGGQNLWIYLLLNRCKNSLSDNLVPTLDKLLWSLDGLNINLLYLLLWVLWNLNNISARLINNYWLPVSIESLIFLFTKKSADLQNLMLWSDGILMIL